MFEWLKGWMEWRRKAVMFEAAVLVQDKDGLITAAYPDGKVQSVTWKELERIEVQTNDTGPWGADVWWVLKGQNSRCAYPQGATGDNEMIPKFMALPGFDDKELKKAMGCTSNKIFTCWERSKTAE